MDLKTEIVALAVRQLSAKTPALRSANSFDELLAVITTGKSHDVRTAEQIIAASGTVAELVKKAATNVKFRKITKNY